MNKRNVSIFWLIYRCLALDTVIKHEEIFCSQFTSCETCAGRHHDSEYTECVWCSIFNSCVSAAVICRSRFRENVDCPLHSAIEYNETFARELGTPLIAAAQGTLMQIQSCVSTIPGNIEVLKRFAIQTAAGERTDGYVAVDHTNQAIIASFSSVASGNKLFHKHFYAEFFTNRQAQFEGSNGLVNRFLYDSWYKLWYVMGMEKTLHTLVKNYTTFDIWFFGHSLGGAKAEMSALSMLLKRLISQDKVRLLTFGSTRVGDMSFVQLIETLVPYRFRIVHGRDMVPHYPRKFDGEWTPPHHHRYEVWYPNGMRRGAKYVVCLGAEDPQCSSRLSPWEIRASDNDIYFERSMQHWVDSFCAENVTYTRARPHPRIVIGRRFYNTSSIPTLSPSLSATSRRPSITNPPLLPTKQHHNSSYSSSKTEIINISMQNTTPFFHRVEEGTLTNATTPIITRSGSIGALLMSTSTATSTATDQRAEMFSNNTLKETAVSSTVKASAFTGDVISA